MVVLTSLKLMLKPQGCAEIEDAIAKDTSIPAVYLPCIAWGTTTTKAQVCNRHCAVVRRRRRCSLLHEPCKGSRDWSRLHVESSVTLKLASEHAVPLGSLGTSLEA